MPTKILTTDSFARWFDNLSHDDAESLLHVIDLLEAAGQTLGSPHASRLQESQVALRELRPKRGKSPLRILYAYDPYHHSVLLIDGDQGIDKKSYHRLIVHAENVWHEFLAQQILTTGTQFHNWSEYKRRRFGVEEIAVSERLAEIEILEINLRSLCELVGKTQAEVSRSVRLGQTELSRAELQHDHLLASLRRYVKALGGELEVVARFGDKSIRLTGV